jgi:ligand-binding sensor domain-containing protein
MKILRPSLTVLLLCASLAYGEIIPGQAVSWSDFSYITTIITGNDYAWFGTTEGILRYHRFEHRWDDPITVSDGLPGHRVERLATFFDETELTVETENGIYSYHSGLGQWFLETEFPRGDYQDSRVRLPLPALFVPLGYSMSPDGYITDNQLRNWRISAALDDQEGTYFFGTWGLGLLAADDRTFTADFLPYGLLQKRVDALYLDGDSLWIGGNGGETSSEYGPTRLGVTLFERSPQRFTHFETRYIPGFDSEIIYDIAGDTNNIYFAGQYGLTIHPRRQDRFFTLGRHDGLPDRETTALAVGRDSVWIGTGRGLALYTPSTDSVVVVASEALSNQFVTELQLVPGKLIIGTTRGAYYIDLITLKVGRLKDPGGILKGLIRHIALYDKFLYVASDWGLVEIDLTAEKSTSVPYTDNANGVYAVAANARYIAAAMSDGLILYERPTGKMRRFNQQDGLLSINITVLLADGDMLWVGSDEGLTRFKWVNPERVD